MSLQISRGLIVNDKIEVYPVIINNHNLNSNINSKHAIPNTNNSNINNNNNNHKLYPDNFNNDSNNNNLNVNNQITNYNINNKATGLTQQMKQMGDGGGGDVHLGSDFSDVHLEGGGNSGGRRVGTGGVVAAGSKLSVQLGMHGR